jgi:branched-chain amino acid transport system substrate-binding protein
MNPEDTVGKAAADYPTKKRIPVISTIGGDDYVYDSPMYFATVPTGTQNGYAMAGGFSQVAIPQGKKKLGVIACAEVQNVCGKFAAMWTSDKMKKLGFESVYQATASLVQPDYTSECLGARQAGAEVLAIAMDNNSVGRIAASCHRQGYKPLFGFSNQVSVNSMLNDPELDGAVAGSNTFAWPAEDTPARKEFHDVFARYRPGQAPGGSNAVGWVAAKTFEAALLKFGVPDQPTPTALLEGLWSLAGSTLGGLSYPLPFVREKPSTPKACYAAVVIKNKAWTAPFGGDMTCEQ